MVETEDLTLYVVDDNQSALRSLCALPEAHGMKAVPYQSAEAFLQHHDPNAQSILLLDIKMPGMSGLQLQSHLGNINSKIPVIIVSGHADVPAAVTAMKRGAVDFIEKPLDVNALLNSIRIAKAQIDSEVVSPVPAQEVNRRLALLTDREREVMNHLILGKTNKQIASDLRISQRTVEVHRSRLQRKMEARNLADLIRLTR